MVCLRYQILEHINGIQYLNILFLHLIASSLGYVDEGYRLGQLGITLYEKFQNRFFLVSLEKEIVLRFSLC